MQYNQADKNITSPALPKPRLSEQLREYLRYQHYRFATENHAYVIRFFIRWQQIKMILKMAGEQRGFYILPPVFYKTPQIPA